jgi:hypothetical protein
VIFLFGAPNAFGNVYCVGLSSCGGTSEPDLQTALDAAKANAGPDSVVIAPGTYTSTTGFDYTDGNNSNTVDISNVPLQPRPTLTLTGTASQQHALTLEQRDAEVQQHQWWFRFQHRRGRAQQQRGQGQHHHRHPRRRDLRQSRADQ